jgi:tRNA threonylcarbamoyl adenosine modification protein (Sua5/YciO/YrdC/YwlC family)
MRDEVVAAIKRGEVVILPLEHGYVYACDAFSLPAVNRLHQLRNDPLGVSAQVLISRIETLGGIAHGLIPEARELASKFWPGLLTLQLPQNQSLNWDLGDGGALADFAVRMPDQNQTLEVIAETGPLAIASAGIAGSGAIALIEDIHNLVALDIGEISPGPSSTVVAQTAGKLVVNRVGALTLEELRKVVSAIELASE